MKYAKTAEYLQKIQRRIRILWLIFAGMLVYGIVVSVLGGGDTRILTDFAQRFSKVVYFGGLVYLLWKIHQNKKYLDGRSRLTVQMVRESDERNRYLHDKSGGIAFDLLLIFLFFIALTASMFHMAAFYTAVTILFLAIAIKLVAYYYYSRRV